LSPCGQAAAAEATESLLTFMRLMRAQLGRMQLHLHRYNRYGLRALALHRWADHASTELLLLALALASVWLATVPHRVTFALFSLYLFARPLRKDSPPLSSRTSSSTPLPGTAGSISSSAQEGRSASVGGSAVGRRPRWAPRHLSDAMLDQWLDGIPLDAPTHRDVPLALHMALQAALQRPS
jgi:hypothetical protein